MRGRIKKRGANPTPAHQKVSECQVSEYRGLGNRRTRRVKKPRNSRTAPRWSKRNFDKNIVKILLAWYNATSESRRPSQADKQILAEKTGLTVQQVTTWFINHRKRAPRRLEPANRVMVSQARARSCRE
uniref:Homeobox domain-containing protein n=1 Tax=Hemiselmis andersenii TaxID=464988 RepID=A0A7S0U1M3_HEMAN